MREISNLYAEFLGQRGRGLDDASSDDIRDWLESMQAEGLSRSTTSRRLSAVRQLHKFAYAEGISSDDPAAVIAAPSRERALPKVMSVGEVDRLLACVREQAGVPRVTRRKSRALRLACLIEVLYATGLACIGACVAHRGHGVR
jgi:integrase/recombinase XerD